MLGKYATAMRCSLIFVLGSTSVYAVSSITSPLAVVLPDLRPGFEFSIAALGLKAGASNLNYVIYNKELPAQRGYQAAVYINAINQYIPASLVEPLDTGGIFVATMSHTQSNYSVQGPFLEASLQI